MSKKLINTGAAAAAAAAVAVGAFLIGNSQSNSTASTANTANPAAQQGGPAFNGQPRAGGQARPGFGPGGGPMGSPVTGAAATKVEQAVSAKYDGQIERVLKLSDGSYLAHVITSNGELRVQVSKSFEVVGEQQGPPGGARPPGAPSATQPKSGSTSS
jgi:hypothetical protein